MPVDPAQLRIDVYPTETLRRKAEPIDVTPEVCAVAARMLELMRGAGGIGLAAPQVGLSWSMFVAHVPPGEERELIDSPASCTEEPEVLINPEIVTTNGISTPMSEGCLSLPGITGDVVRQPFVTIRAQGLDGAWVERNAGGLLARCYQHEFDHLVGVLILDKMTPTSRLRVRSAVRALERRAI